MGFSWNSLFRFGRGKPSAPPPRGGRRNVRAGFDALTRTDNNRRQRENLDYLSPNAQITPEVRREMRALARYETANNSYAKGIVTTLANDCVGRGPRLQMLTDNPKANRALEAEFAAWSKVVDLAGKLRTIRMAKAVDGEAFAMRFNNPGLQSPVMLDLQLIEADRIATPLGKSLVIESGDRTADGIHFDRYGNAITYDVLRNHPGALFVGLDEADVIPAGAMMHLFRVDRPGQLRGISELMPALPLFEQMRRYTLAVIGAAEIAADWAGILYSDAPADGADPSEPFESIELESRMLLTVPSGHRMEQIKAEQPTTAYGDFIDYLLNEAARCLNIPFNVAKGNSASYNYASGRLDHQTYFKAVGVERSVFECRILDPLLIEWLKEAALSLGIVPPELRDAMRVPHQWYWDGHPHVDPQKDANAQSTRLTSGTTNLAIECAADGRDWEEVQDQQLFELARKQRRMRELGIQPEPAPTANTTPSEEDSHANSEEEVEV